MAYSALCLAITDVSSLLNFKVIENILTDEKIKLTSRHKPQLELIKDSFT